ncbi:uncharacterized protein [Penaeus vannamei]|uniref:Uncharacterized protein n=1 Tax=Penaeus vannamei TaxID=6689 RepID=A0A423TL72_PENVA|nr:uncharacterized protein LOC113804660 [Penaeus vannamei]ROT77214.1 hypothetical protein C7M84_004137 [Penaeus vannamei]
MGSRDVGAETATLQFTYSYPMYEVDEPDGTKNTIALSSIAVGLILFLETLLDEGPATSTSAGRAERSIQEDQLEVFRQIEDNISSLGVDGRACVLRFICEMQTNRFSRSSLFGELFTLLFTPKPGGDYTVLKEYIAAEEEGRQGGKDSPGCAHKYRMCPLSVFAALRRLRGDVAEERPANATVSSPTGVSYLKDSVPWAWDAFAGEGY